MTSPVKSRRYSSSLRQEQAALTKRRILEAAAELFTGQGFGPTTIRAIAEHAKVAPDTVYATFGTKAKLLTALIDWRLAPSGESSILDRPQMQGIRDEHDPRRLLQRFAADYADIAARVRPVSEVLRTAKAVDPAMAAVRDELEAHRLEFNRTVIDWLSKRSKLRVSKERAAHITWTLASPDVSRMLCDVQGWTTKEYGDWLADTLIAALLR